MGGVTPQRSCDVSHRHPPEPRGSVWKATYDKGGRDHGRPVGGADQSSFDDRRLLPESRLYGHGAPAGRPEEEEGGVGRTWSAHRLLCQHFTQLLQKVNRVMMFYLL